MDARVDLAPLPRRRLRYETQFLSKSNNFVGPALKLGYQNRNLFRGGELLNVDLNGGFETQFAGGRQTGLNAFEVGLKGELVFPRILSPIDLGGNLGYGLPRTRLVSGVSLLNRVNFYRLRSFQAGFGYQWQTNRFVSHDLQPAAISFTGLSRTSAAFDAILAANPFLRQSFEQRFIAGLVYQGTFSELAENKPHRWVAIVGLDAAGNLPGLITGSDQLFGETLARYVRLDADIRYHRVFSADRRLVLRVFGGYGYSYGASPTLPYIKQYFAGGPNSVRAFNIRSLGPGNYRPANFDLASFFDQAGDIKLEANVEYRFPLVPYLKGAVFADAGNIWLQRPNPALRGGHFTSQWAQELGVGAGFGLRIDADILVLRFDLATPLRKPWLPTGERWFDSFSLADRDWRRENLNLVFAIGYPF
jgi:outer membrane protein assembly factor BamA